MEDKAKETTVATRTGWHPVFDLMERWEPMRWLMDQREDLAIPVEEYVEDGQMVIRAELPGIDPEKDVSITLEDGAVRIHAERREEHTEDKPNRYRSEIRYGSFTRTIPLAGEADADLVAATYADGVLTVRVPMVEETAEPKQIPITRG